MMSLILCVRDSECTQRCAREAASPTYVSAADIQANLNGAPNAATKSAAEHSCG